MPLRAAGVVTKLVTDHPHLFEHGGENYHCDFTAWDYRARPRRRPVAHPPGPVMGGCTVVRTGLDTVRLESRLVPGRSGFPWPSDDDGGRPMARRRGGRP